jgi:small GTP-binding protein
MGDLFTPTGFPSVGKSSLLQLLTGTESEVAAYEFTTLTCIPGIIHYNDSKIQLLDLPGIIEGAAEGKGRGRQVGMMCVKQKGRHFGFW